MKKFILHINLLILALLLTACQDSDEQLIRSQQGTLQVVDSNGVVRFFLAHWLSPQLILLPKNLHQID